MSSTIKLKLSPDILTALSHVRAQLDMAPNSPYARIVRVIFETFLESYPEFRDRFIIRQINLKEKPADLFDENNPLGKVPKLTWTDETTQETDTIVDSRSIAMFLAGAFHAPKLSLKSDKEEKVFDTAREVMEIAVANFYERRGQAPSKGKIDQNTDKLKEKINTLKRVCKDLPSTTCGVRASRPSLTIAEIAAVCAWDYAAREFDVVGQVDSSEPLYKIHQLLSTQPGFMKTMPGPAAKPAVDPV